MTRVSDRFLQLAVVAALCGMVLGIGMGLTENFQLQAVHAHINLLGWVSMTLFGLFYRVVPKAAEGRLPAVHFWLNVVGFLAMMAFLAATRLGVAAAGMPLGLASVLVVLSMLVFAAIVFRTTWKV